MLHGAFPQVLARPGAVQPENKRVLLLPALRGEVRGAGSGALSDLGEALSAARTARRGRTYLIVVLHHDQSQFALFKIHFGNFRPGQRENTLKVQSAGRLSTQTAVSFLLVLSLGVLQKSFIHSSVIYAEVSGPECQTPTKAEQGVFFKQIWVLPISLRHHPSHRIPPQDRKRHF